MTATGTYFKDREERPRWWSSVYYWHQIQTEEEDKVEALLADIGKAD